MRRTEGEILDALLNILGVADVETMDAILDDDLYDPIGCGCCGGGPFNVWYSSWDKKGNPNGRPKSTYRFISDPNYKLRLNPEYEED